MKHLTRSIKTLADYESRALSRPFDDFFAKFYNSSEHFAVDEVM
jgi:hypothetical protein